MIDKNMNSACMQSVHPLHGYQSNPIMDPASPHPAWQFGTQTVKNEPMEEDKNDSGITSGSEFHSSSPGSDNSQDVQQYHPNQTQTNRFYPVLPQYLANPYKHHPLTPPNSEPLVSPKSEKEENDMDTTLTPCSSPSQKRTTENQDHLRRLEMSLEKCGLFSQTGEAGEMKSDDAKDDDNLAVPRMNSHGKVKTFKCKQCDFVAITKAEQWNHSRVHIKKEKILTCPKCSFVTEYKHHLEYHLRGHAGSKPFQCTKCEYTCVNKSMLNSHMKSHSNIYRYSCSDCSYATKYCHSLKIHLRRYRHTPNVVLDEEGNPCPDIIIDVHGTRRGPRIKTQQKNEENCSPIPEAMPFLNFPFTAYPFIPNPQILQQLIRERQALVAPPTVEEPPDSVLDLSKPGSSGEQKNRRKGPPTKIDTSVLTESDEDDESASTTMFSNVEVVQNMDEGKKETTPSSDNNNNKGNENKCQFCNIIFGDVVMYTLHMGQHDFNDPFTCNICKKECSDKLSFFMHGFHH